MPIANARRIEPATMLAMAFPRPDAALSPRACELPIPTPGPGQLLVRVHAAGVGHWDRHEVAGTFACRPGRAVRFPHVGGSEGAGVVVAIGSGVTGFREGDRVYGLVTQREPKQGCHAEFTLFDATLAWRVPPRLALDQAAVLPVDGAIALHALQDVLRARAGDALVLFGASGGIGHLALQLARNLGVRTLAIASGDDGRRLAERLGADMAIDGRRGGVEAAIARFAPTGRCLALLTAGGEAAARVVATLPTGSEVAWPHGVAAPAPTRSDLTTAGFGCRYDPAMMHAFHAVAEQGPLVPHVSQRYRLEQLPLALEAMSRHHLGRIAVLAA